jgi:hypothetical protein
MKKKISEIIRLKRKRKEKKRKKRLMQPITFFSLSPMKAMFVHEIDISGFVRWTSGWIVVFPS